MNGRKRAIGFVQALLVTWPLVIGATSGTGLGCAKTKSDLVVMPSEDEFLRFFALRTIVGLKIPGAVIPRSVFTQPGSFAADRGV